MPYVDKSQPDSESTEFVSNMLACKACGEDFPSTERKCPHCNIYRDADQTAETPTTASQKLTGEACKRLDGGGTNCKSCGQFYYHYDVKDSKQCPECGVPLTGETPKAAPKTA